MATEEPSPTAPVAAAQARGPAPAEGGRGQISQAGEQRSARVESVRAIAALGVVVGHVFGTAHLFGPATMSSYPRRVIYGGGFGVLVFFALSGYLMFWPFARHLWGASPRIALRQYALNRVLRIVPLYYFTIVFLLLVQEHGGTATQWLHFMTWTEPFSQATVGTVDPVVWSLTVEVIFYALLPPLAAGLAWASGAFASPRAAGSPATRSPGVSRARAAAILLVLGGASCLFYMDVTWARLSEIWRESFPANFGFLVPGMLVALLRTHWQERSPRWLSRSILGSADAWLLTSLALWLVVWEDYQLVPVADLACLLLVGGVVLPLRPGPILRSLGWRPLATLGIATYSLYMWHMPLIRLFAGTGVPSYGFSGLFIRVLPSACLVALLSYHVIEAPFLRLRGRWSDADADKATGGSRLMGSGTVAGWLRG